MVDAMRDLKLGHLVASTLVLMLLAFVPARANADDQCCRCQNVKSPDPKKTPRRSYSAATWRNTLACAMFCSDANGDPSHSLKDGRCDQDYPDSKEPQIQAKVEEAARLCNEADVRKNTASLSDCLGACSTMDNRLHDCVEACKGNVGCQAGCSGSCKPDGCRSSCHGSDNDRRKNEALSFAQKCKEHKPGPRGTCIKWCDDNHDQSREECVKRCPDQRCRDSCNGICGPKSGCYSSCAGMYP